MADKCYLGVDLGAESGRVMAGLFDGKTIRLEEMHRFSNGATSLGGSLRWNVLNLWSDIKRGLAVAAERYGDGIASVGVDTWGVDYVLLSKTNEILGQPFHYRDDRNIGMMEYAFSKVSREDIFAATGVQFIVFNTLYQLIATQKQHPELLDAADALLMMPDFFHWCLSGERSSEFTEATTSQCLDAATGDWSFDLLNKFDIPTNIFQPAVSPGTKIGALRDDLAAETGLKRIDVVAPASHDTGSAVAAVPTRNTGKPNWAYISSGTWSLVGVEVKPAILSPDVLKENFTNEGGVDGTYRLLKNIMGLWLVQQCKRAFERRGENYDYAQLAQMASKAPAFRSIVNPDDPRFLNPSDMTEAIQTVCKESGQPEPETPGQFVRCALESLALKYDVVIQTAERLTGQSVEVIHIVGGGCQNQLLNQLTANACGKPVVTGPIEATVLGNLLVQARASGDLGSLQDIRDVVRASSEMVDYEPTQSEAWTHAKERFQALLSNA
ncbi:MAG: rhamnulokinase family protein [Candidatus Hinthialibacter antarcticus]|nr:rhamnulokinase family protein [Candidatus Hinthialibacter antarcticus]